jgi:hypothetical protein
MLLHGYDGMPSQTAKNNNKKIFTQPQDYGIRGKSSIQGIHREI